MKAAKLFLFCTMILNMCIYSQWIQTATPDGGGITDMAVLSDGTIIATTSSFNWPSVQGGIRRSTNEGATWQNVVNAFNGRTLHLGSSGKIFASYWPYPNEEGLYISTNGGLNWTQSFSAGILNNVFSITSKDNDNTVFIGTRTGVVRSINNGAWQSVSAGMPANAYVYALDIDFSGNYIAAGTSKGLYVSSNNGANWSAVSGITQSDTIYCVKFAHNTTDATGDKLFAGISDGELARCDPELLTAAIIFSFLGRISDMQHHSTGLFGRLALTIASHNSDNLIDPGFAYSTDGGVTWTQNNSGLPLSPAMSALTYQVQGSSIRYYSGIFENTTGGAKIYKMNLPIGIHNISNEIPNGFTMSQNYPNPFNPMTKIKLQISKLSYTKLIVFDVLGKEVEILVNETLKPGTYEVDFDGANIQAEFIFIELMPGGFPILKK